MAEVRLTRVVSIDIKPACLLFGESLFTYQYFPKDVCGFKSFREKVSVQFSGGMNCVVGENGSGKTNTLDGTSIFKHNTKQTAAHCDYG